ncbi:hypothetical protein ANCCAN_01654 [Ancylostoma caninum]|uniref:Uncharacterized protein n=1 Tax=Ancylostoma caninum TaxID=29170 RepID=A0A368H6J8_ANCCA|nr:hypothetical protein ANCCAN_01654 [Ancylostoma caninum]
MTEYNTIGCASFTGDDPLAEELNPTGCAKFSSEQLEVTACFETKDRAAIGRARANQEIAVFILIMLCIVVSGAVWKFELHKKLFRSSYDTVAGG